MTKVDEVIVLPEQFCSQPVAQAYKDGINRVKNKDFPTSLQSLEILIQTEDVKDMYPRFGRLR